MSCDFIALANAGVRAISPYEPGKPIEEVERELGLTDVVKLASNESPIGPGPLALEAARAALDDVGRYPDGNGFALKRALAERLGVDEAQITLGNGSNDVLELVARAYVNESHEVVFSEHAFVVYPLATLAVGATPVQVPARAFGCDLEAMAEAIGERTRMVFIANPNNPTGTWVGAEAFGAFMERVPEDVVVVLDEAYREYVDLDDYPDGVALLARHPNLVVTRTFSKAYGLAGLRVGYSVSNPEIANLMNRVRQPFNVNSLSLAAAEAALGDAQHLERARAVNRDGMRALGAGLDGLGLERIPSAGNFITVRTPRPGREVFEALLREGVIVRPIGGYGMPDHVRVTVGLPQENARFLAALERVLAT